MWTEYSRLIIATTSGVYILALRYYNIDIRPDYFDKNSVKIITCCSTSLIIIERNKKCAANGLGEVVAANAMTFALGGACNRGYVDTAVLAELSGQIELLEIDSEATSIHSITYLPAESQLTIAFEARDKPG